MDTTPFGGNGKSFVGSDLIGMCSEQTPSQDHDVHQVTAIPYCSDSKADGNWMQLTILLFLSGR